MKRRSSSAPDDPLSLYLYGDSLVRSLGGRRPQDDAGNARLARAIAALEKSVQLRPSTGMVWARLGFAFNLAAQSSPRAVVVLEKAHELLPGRSDVALNLVLAYARVGNRENAEALVDRLDKIGADEATRGRARDVLLQMDYQVARRLYGAGKYDDAVAVFTRIQANASDPSLRQAATSGIAEIEPLITLTRFTELYNEAVRRLKRREIDEAAAALGELRPIARPGRQREMVDELLQVVKEMRSPEP